MLGREDLELSLLPLPLSTLLPALTKPATHTLSTIQAVTSLTRGT